MTPLMALTLAGSWTYAGLLAEPSPSPPTPPPALAAVPPPSTKQKPTPVPKPSPTPGPRVDEAQAATGPKLPPSTPARPSAPATPPAPAPALAPNASPSAYRLADSSGQEWEHADADQLRSFIAARNRSLIAPLFYYPASSPRSSRCANGRCE